MISSCDTLVELLEAIQHFVNRLNIYTQIPSTPAMDEIVIKILVELLSTLARVTEKLKQRRSSESVIALSLMTCYLTERPWHTVKLANNFFGEKGVEAVLQRLDRLTQDEARTTAAQTLHVVYGLVQNMSAVVDGEQTRSACNLLPVE